MQATAYRTLRGHYQSAPCDYISIYILSSQHGLHHPLKIHLEPMQCYIDDKLPTHTLDWLNSWLARCGHQSLLFSGERKDTP